MDTEGGDSLLCVVGWHGLREMGPAPASKLWGGSAFALCASEGLIASNAGFGPIPLPDRAFRCRHHGIGPAAVWCLLALAIAHSRSLR